MSYHAKEYRTQEQFKEICDSMINGNWSHAAIECVKYAFYQNDLLTAYDEEQLIDSSFDDDTYILRGLVTIAEMSQSIRHEKYCNYRPCPSCDEHGQTLEIDQLCDKCEATKRE